MGDADEVRGWLVNRLAKGKSLSDEDCGRSYFDQGLVDSLGVIELIEDLEQQYSIRFTEAHFQQRRFATIDGLSELVQELRDAG